MRDIKVSNRKYGKEDEEFNLAKGQLGKTLPCVIDNFQHYILIKHVQLLCLLVGFDEKIWRKIKPMARSGLFLMTRKCLQME